MDVWMDGWESRVKDCLQQSKRGRKKKYQKNEIKKEKAKQKSHKERKKENKETIKQKNKKTNKQTCIQTERKYKQKINLSVSLCCGYFLISWLQYNNVKEISLAYLKQPEFKELTRNSWEMIIPGTLKSAATCNKTAGHHEQDRFVPVTRLL